MDGGLLGPPVPGEPRCVRIGDREVALEHERLVPIRRLQVVEGDRLERVANHREDAVLVDSCALDA